MIKDLFGEQREREVLPSPLREFRSKTLRLVAHAAIAIGGCVTFGFVLLALLHINARGPHFFVIRFLTDVPTAQPSGVQRLWLALLGADMSRIDWLFGWAQLR
jgi:hypothetical protein